MSLIKGKFELESSENYDAYLKAVGVSPELRELAKTCKPTIEVSSKPDGSIYIKTHIPGRIHELTFPIDKEFDEVTSDGRQCKSKVVKDGENTLKHMQTIGKDSGVVTREFTPTHLKMTHEGGGEKAIRIYKRIE